MPFGPGVDLVHRARMTPDQIQSEIDRAATVEVVQPDGSIEMQTHPPIPIAMIKPRGDNPRRNTDAAKVLANAITEVGWGAPILVQKETGFVIGGHTRLKAAEILGLERLPVRIIDVDDRRAKAMALADNRIGELADWNFPGLAEHLSEFGLGEAEALGFDTEYLEKLADKVDGFGPLDGFPELPSGDKIDVEQITFYFQPAEAVALRAAMAAVEPSVPPPHTIPEKAAALAAVCEAYLED